MAKGRAAPVFTPPSTPKFKGPNTVIVSISLASLLLASLLAQLFGSSGRSDLTAPSSNQPKIIPLPPSPYNPDPDPIAGEVLVRFEPATALALHRELAESTRPFGQPPLPDSLLIGARMNGARTAQAVPDLAPLFVPYRVRAA